MKAALPALQLSLQFADARHRTQLPRHRVARCVRATLQVPGEITVRIVGADEGRALNRDYRGKDYATNVLSFPYDSGARVCGDLVLCKRVVESEAGEQQKPLEAHYAHLIVHGMLHLQGHDHETSSGDAERMEALEREILEVLGYPDPYA